MKTPGAVPSFQRRLGILIRRARVQGGFSQERFAPLLGIGTRDLQKIEAGEVHPHAEVAMRFLFQLSGADAREAELARAEAPQPRWTEAAYA